MKIADLFARLAIKIDKGDFDKADSRLGGLAKKFGRVAKVASVVGGALGAFGATRLVKLASDAEETGNVINEVFGEAGDTVRAWAEQQAKVLGRSGFELREFAANTGAIIEPMLGSSEAAAQMSTGLAQLAVDLGSFFNKTDQDALRALQSGLTGETEPLKKFGIVMTQANLQLFARQRGVRKNINELTQAQKTELRYQFILANTVKAQGDAARTSGGLANSTKRLRGQLIDLGTRLGQKLLPLASELVAVLIELTPALETLGGLFVILVKAIAAVAKIITGAFKAAIRLFTGSTDLAVIAVGALVASLITFKGAAIAAGLAAARAWLIGLAPLVLFAAGVIALILILEDLWQALTGGESFLKDLFDAAVEMVAEWIEVWVEAFKEFWDGLIDLAADAIGKVVDKARQAAQKIKEFLLGEDNEGTVGLTLSSGEELQGIENIRAAAAGGNREAQQFVRQLDRQNAINQNNNITVNATGGDPEAIRRAIQPAVQEVLDDNLRKTAAAVGS